MLSCEKCNWQETALLLYKIIFQIFIQQSRGTFVIISLPLSLCQKHLLADFNRSEGFSAL